MLLPRHIGNSVSVYLFLESEPLLGKSEEFNNQGMKENGAFRILLISKKKKIIKKIDRLCMEFSWSHNTKCTEVPQPSTSTQPFSDVPSFSKISQFPG